MQAASTQTNVVDCLQTAYQHHGQVQSGTGEHHTPGWLLPLAPQPPTRLCLWLPPCRLKEQPGIPLMHRAGQQQLQA
jgi:hypothetical protein